ncbi:hypothetical protein PoB_007465500 [Plakobranchus ocellatus]|uniref:Uncharacterized protein n=1 Tax=Plakobranchus ocellatus TaxID=259542 RepID=A0AAV4DVQ8_9GAST|nr:hypothetical protein PoB_007465500 [Plakobranchus ocellatus]
MVPPPSELCGIPGLGLVPDQEIRRYKLHPKPGSSQSSPTENINIGHFLGLCLCGSTNSYWWDSAFAAVPILIGCTRRYIYATVSSADV